MKTKSARVDFGMVKTIALVGIVIGGLVAIAVPFVAFAYGANVGIGNVVATILSLIALVGGLVLALLSAFFGIVIPSKVDARKDEAERDEEADAA